MFSVTYFFTVHEHCAWAGSQRYGALVWSGDIHSDWESFRKQLCAGLNMGIAGIPWWTTDIGGFIGSNPKDPAFRQLLVRWFQWGTFCPVIRLHGDRVPHTPVIRKDGSCSKHTGAGNEVWSFGILAGMDFILVCTYEKAGKNPELLIYKKR